MSVNYSRPISSPQSPNVNQVLISVVHQHPLKMSPAEFHHLERFKLISRELTNSTAVTAAAGNKQSLIIGGSIGLFIALCALIYVIKPPVMMYLRKRRQTKEMEGYSLELQQARQKKAAERVDDGEGGKDGDVEGKEKGKASEAQG